MTSLQSSPEHAMSKRSLGSQVRSVRESAGLSLRELARRVGITPSYLCDIELDRRRPSETTWKAITLRLSVYGGALVDELVADLQRNQPNVYAAVLLRGMVQGRRNAEQEYVNQRLPGEKDSRPRADGTAINVRLADATETGPCNQCGGGDGLGHTPDCPAVAGNRSDMGDALRALPQP